MFDMPREAGAQRALRPARRRRGGSPGETDRPMVVFEAKGEPVAAALRAIAGLPANPLLPRKSGSSARRAATLTIAGGGAAPFAIDGASFADWSAKPSFAVPRGAPVTLGLVNKTAFAQTMRLNGHVGRLLHALDDGWEPYWRDIILVAPGKTVHIAFVADNPGKWPIGSAIPELRSAGLAAWMQVG